MIPENQIKSSQITELLKQHGFLKHEMGIAIIDLKNPKPEIFGYNLDHFIYPASVYKIFIGAEMLRQIEAGIFSFDQKVVIKEPNDVDKDARIFPGDTRKLLNAGDEVTIDHLLDLMLTRSDNTASNQLIDLVGRENIITNIIHTNNWHGSEVTRKFLDRIKEDKKYQFSETTKTCARHITEFMYLVETSQLISPFVSQHLKVYMERWSRTGRGGLSLPNYSIYRKGGYLETNLYKKKLTSLIKNVLTKGWAYICWLNDAAVITGNNSHYAISVFTVTKSLNPNKKFPIKELAKVIHDFMNESAYNENLKQYISKRNINECLIQKYFDGLYNLTKDTYPGSDLLFLTTHNLLEVMKEYNTSIKLDQLTKFEILVLNNFLSSRYSLLAFEAFRGIRRKNGQHYIVHIYYCIFTSLIAGRDSSEVIEAIILHDLLEEGLVARIKNNESEKLPFTEKKWNGSQEDVIEALKTAFMNLSQVIKPDKLLSIIIDTEPEIPKPSRFETIDDQYFFPYINLLEMIVKHGSEKDAIVHAHDRIDALMNTSYITSNNNLTEEQKLRALKRVTMRSITSIHILSQYFNLKNELELLDSIIEKIRLTQHYSYLNKIQDIFDIKNNTFYNIFISKKVSLLNEIDLYYLKFKKQLSSNA